MIIQCQGCQTRFRLADEKIKPGGIKVRCSKCKEIFFVTLPEPEVEEPPTAPVAVETEPGLQAKTEETDPAEPPLQERPSETGEEGLDGKPEPDQEEFQEPTPDVKEPQEGVDSAGTDDQVADQFATEDGDNQPDWEDSAARQEEEDTQETQQEDFVFGDEQETSAASEEQESNYIADEASEKVEFPFGVPDDDTSEAPDFSFDDQAGDSSNRVDETVFSFEEETPEEETAADWEDESPTTETFDFDEPQFDDKPTPDEEGLKVSDEGGLKFGEIEFSDTDNQPSPTVEEEEIFPKESLQLDTSETHSMEKSEHLDRPPLDHETLKVQQKPKKSSLTRILVLLIILLVVLAGAAGLITIQDGTLKLDAVTQHLPFLKDFIGSSEQVPPGERIGINVSGSSYINGQDGQLLVVQGEAVNNHTDSRSSITIKAILLDAQGKTLRQQTVFCGNPIDNAKLAAMPFSTIEEAMNNEFGDSLSNMNIAPGSSIPFTIVFRNLPAGIAKINVEVVDSKPGAS